MSDNDVVSGGSAGASGNAATERPDTVPAERADTPLGLGDVFVSSPARGWEESRFEIADRSDVAGMGVGVETCRDDVNAAQLEYRLANRFRKLTFSVGQGNRSLSSDQKLAVRIVGNEDQLEIQMVPFNEIKPITVDVTGVNALKIRLFLDDEDRKCDHVSAVTAVIVDLRVQ